MTSRADPARAILSPEALRDRLRWRYAVRRFDPARAIPDAHWKALESALVLSPSSFNLQPWKFFVVDDPSLRARLKPVSWNQGQVVDAARLVVFAARRDFGPPDVDRLVARMAEVRGEPVSSLAFQKEMMLGWLTVRTPAVLRAWIARQVYVALGTFLTSAAVLGIDACPIEALEQDPYDRILGLRARGYTTLVAAAAGYRAADDADAGVPKVRFALPEVLEHL